MYHCLHDEICSLLLMRMIHPYVCSQAQELFGHCSVFFGITMSECNVFRDQFVVKTRKIPNQLFVASLHGVDIDY